MGLLQSLHTDAWVTLGILLITLVLLVTNKVRIDLIGLFILLALGIGGLVKEEELFAGFGSEAVIVIAAMLAIGEAQTMGVNPVPFVVGIIAAVSASPITYVSHKVYLVIMAPGGYKFSDYVKFGLPLTIVCFLVTMLWPF